MARTYKRDSNGRFASGGGGSTRPKARSAPRGINRLTRDNAGRITSVGGQGATARGGRLRTAAGNRRAVQTARIGGKRAGVVGKPKGLKPGAVKMAKGGARQSRDYTSLAAVAARRERVTRGWERLRGSVLQKRKTVMIRSAQSSIYEGQRRLSQTGRLTLDIVKQGTPKGKRTADIVLSNFPRGSARKPAKKRAPKTGRDIQLEQVRKVQNQKLRDLNRRIKEGGPLARELRLEKLKLQDAMQATRPRRR